MSERTITGGATFSLGVLFASLGAVACTANTATVSGDGGNSVSSPADGASTCQTGGLPSDTYVPGMQKVGTPASGNPDDAGASDALTFILVNNEIMGAASSPAEPFTNVFTLKLVDSSGQPVKDAMVLLPTNSQALGWTNWADPWMPLHNHGASVLPTVTNNGDGTYAVSVDLFMAGLWQIYLVAKTATVTDKAMFSFCLE